MILMVPQRAENTLNSWATISFLKRIFCMDLVDLLIRRLCNACIIISAYVHGDIILKIQF
jgi:hypothetical protein